MYLNSLMIKSQFVLETLRSVNYEKRKTQNLYCPTVSSDDCMSWRIYSSRLERTIRKHR